MRVTRIKWQIMYIYIYIYICIYIHIYMYNFDENKVLKRIPNHCTLNKFQHQRHVRVYYWLIAESSQSIITGLQLQIWYKLYGQMYCLAISFYNISAINSRSYNIYTKINGHKKYTLFKLYCFGKSSSTFKACS